MSEPERAPRYVLAHPSVKVYATASASTPVYEGPGDPKWSASQTEVTVLRLIAEHGDRLEVESVPRPNPWRVPSEHCTQHTLPRYPAKLRFFIDRAQVIPLVSRPVVVEHADGTAIEIRPGTLVRQEDHIFIVEVNGLELRVELRRDDLGWWYEVAPLYDVHTGWRSEEFAIAPAALSRGEVRFGGRAVTGQGVDNEGPYYGDHVVTAVERGKLESLVTVRSRCTDFRVLVPNTGVIDAYAGRLRIVGTTDDWASELHLPTGTPLYWRGGGEAGTVVFPTAHRWRFSPDLEPNGERRCFDAIGHRSSSASPFTLCFDPEALVRQRAD